jgi:hypothetical protein
MIKFLFSLSVFITVFFLIFHLRWVYNNFRFCVAVLWIRIRRICIILPDLDPGRDRHMGYADPDLYKFQVNKKIDNVDFFKKISICCLSKILQTYDPFDTDRK